MGQNIPDSAVMGGTGGSTAGELRDLGYSDSDLNQMKKNDPFKTQEPNPLASLGTDIKQAGQQYDAQRQAIQNRGGAPQFNITQPQLDMSLFSPYADPTKQRKSFWG